LQQAMTDDPLPFDLSMVEEVLPRWADLHATATRVGGPALTPADLDRLRALDAEQLAALAAGRVDEAIAADDAFHQVFLQAAGDPDLQVSVDLLLPRLRRMDLWIFTRKSFSGGTSTGTHPAIIEALERRDFVAAAELVRRSYLEPAADLAAALATRDR
jgi:DNA-binding GntR family transcriptional regulator